MATSGHAKEAFDEMILRGNPPPIEEIGAMRKILQHTVISARNIMSMHQVAFFVVLFVGAVGFLFSSGHPLALFGNAAIVLSSLLCLSMLDRNKPLASTARSVRLTRFSNAILLLCAALPFVLFDITPESSFHIHVVEVLMLLAIGVILFECNGLLPVFFRHVNSIVKAEQALSELNDSDYECLMVFFETQPDEDREVILRYLSLVKDQHRALMTGEACALYRHFVSHAF